MAASFEDALAKAQSEMVAAALEYIGGRAERIYLFALSAGGMTSFSVFYRIGQQPYRVHKVNEANDGGPAHDVTPPRQLALQKYGIKQLKELQEAAEQFGQPMPTLIKAVYDVARGSLSSDIRYDDFYSDSNRAPGDFVTDWFDEESAKSA